MREIADFLNISVRAVESRIRRSKQQLKKELFHMVEDILKHNQLSRPFEETVMLEIIPRIASIEIPVSNMDKAIAWYEEIIGAKAGFRDTEQGTAMLHLNNGAGAVGVPSLYLVETDDTTRLSFFNTLYGYEQSIIDFYTTDLAKFYTFLKENNIAVPEIDFDKEERSGFGFHDPDGNSLGVCSVTHEGQQGEDRVDGAWIERIATVEIPVSHLQSAEDWYCKCFGMKIKQREDNEWSLLHLQGDDRTGVPTIFLVQTDAEQRLTFQNTKTSINHSIIDFYSPDLHKFHRYLSGLGVRVTGFNPLDGGELGGFGITDPDGNLLAACNFVNKGQSQPSQDK
jgi:catechol 2,3-dioxygenase-like lactoylglutathione lyase family enzyme